MYCSFKKKPNVQFNSNSVNLFSLTFFLVYKSERRHLLSLKSINKQYSGASTDSSGSPVLPQKPVLDGSKPVSPRSIAINKPVVQAKDDIIRRLMLFLNHLEILNIHNTQYMAGVKPK